MEEISGSIYFRPLGGPEGCNPGHEINGDLHTRDHTTVLFNGHWRAVKERKVSPDKWEVVHQVTIEAPYHMLIEGGCRHSFKYFGELVPLWMEPFLAKMPSEEATAFRKQYGSQRGRAWCVYSRSRDDHGAMRPPAEDQFY